MIGHRKLSVALLAILGAFVLVAAGKVTGGECATIVTATVSGFFAANLFGDHRSKP